MDNWNWVEVVWTLTAAVGALFSFRNIWLGFQDLQVLDDNDDKGLKWELLHIIARGNIRRDVLRAVAQVIWISTGIFAGNIPSGSNGLTIAGILIGLAFIVPSVMFTFSAIIDYNDRIRSIRIGKMLESEESNVI